MATRKPRTARLVNANGAPHDSPAQGSETDTSSPLDSDRPSPISAGEQDSLMDLLAGFTDAVAVTVKVYRVIKNRPLAYVYECSPETFSMDSLRDDYGGGEFRVYIHEGGRLVKNVRVMVEPPRKPASESPAIDAAVTAMRERQDKTDKLLEALAAKVMAPAPPPPSLGSMLGALDLPAVITAFGTLLTVIRPPAPALPPPPPPAPTADPMAGVELFMKAFELAREIKGDGGGETSLMDVVRDLIKSPMLAQAVQAAAETPGAAPARQLPPPIRPPMPPLMPGRPPQPRPINTPLGPVAPPQRRPEDHPVNPAPLAPNDEGPQQMATVDTSRSAIIGQMEFLCFQAANNADPELYAGLILDQLDDETILGILEWQPDPVSALIAQYPPAAPHRDWFQQVVEYVALAFEEEPGELGVEAGVQTVEVLQSEGLSDDKASGDASGHNTPIPAGGTATG